MIFRFQEDVCNCFGESWELSLRL